jgi:hypothetical protein
LTTADEFRQDHGSKSAGRVARQKLAKDSANRAKTLTASGGHWEWRGSSASS